MKKSIPIFIMSMLILPPLVRSETLSVLNSHEYVNKKDWNVLNKEISETNKYTKDDSSATQNLLIEIPNFKEIRKYSKFSFNKKALHSSDSTFKPAIQVGAIVHMFASAEQDGYMKPGTAEKPTSYSKSFSLYRTRILVGGQLSRKGSFFIESELPTPIGISNPDETKNVKVASIILDAQYHHHFSDAFEIIAGQQLVSNNRNGLQGAGSLLANDFSYFQYPYNLFEDSPLQGNFGRDLGINTRGLLFADKLEYRAGVFTGRNVDGKDPLRIVARLAYNFLDPDRNYYYAGTNLGKGKTLTLGMGHDRQGTYINNSVDLFLDHPVGSIGSLTLNGAFQYMTGGTSTKKYAFTKLIPAQTIQFMEVGFYFKNIKIQPWVKYENQQISAKAAQIVLQGQDVNHFNKLNSSSVLGSGVNYFFNELGTNLRLSYNTRTYHILNSNNNFDKKTYGQFWLQLQFFIF